MPRTTTISLRLAPILLFALLCSAATGQSAASERPDTAGRNAAPEQALATPQQPAPAQLAPKYPVAPRQSVAVGFWNLENFYDTIPSPFYDDTEYTPQGAKHWDTERYNQKVKNLARVLDDMSLDVAGLGEVENEATVRDLVTALKTDYCYIHRTTSDLRGMDMALLYKGDKFIPERVRQVDIHSTREALYVRGLLLGERVDIVVCHLPSNFNDYDYRARAIRALYDFSDSLQRADPGARLIIMGDMNASADERIFKENFPLERYGPLVNALANELTQRRGSYAYGSRWQLIDNIFISGGLLYGPGLRRAQSGIFIRDYMLSQGSAALRKGYPLRTFVGDTYTGGFSDHLPVYIIFEKASQ